MPDMPDIQQATFSQKTEKHSNKNNLPLKNFEELQMFSMRRLSVRLQMFSFYKNIICVDKSLRFLHHVWVRIEMKIKSLKRKPFSKLNP